MNKLKYLLVLLSALFLAACGGGGGSSGNRGGTASSATTSQSSSVTYTATPGEAASISIASGDKIDNSDDIFYQKRFAATVANTLGVPVRNAVINLKVQYPGFYKGRFFRDADNKVTSVNQFFCPGEDANNDDVLNPGEDINGNNVLDPAKALVTASIEGPNVTDQNGNVSILVRWPKRHAFWVQYRLIANVTVTGTEGTGSFVLRTSYAAGDDEVVSTPFITSPYGVGPNCSDIN
jgi:hypothetical protein